MDSWRPESSHSPGMNYINFTLFPFLSVSVPAQFICTFIRLTAVSLSFHLALTCCSSLQSAQRRGSQLNREGENSA